MSRGLGDVYKRQAITCGPARSSKMLTDAAAVGVDSMLHVEVDTSEMDSKQIQSILAAAVKHCDADVILCGKQAADTNSGSTGPGVASLIDAACVGMVSEVSVDGDGFSALRGTPSGNESCGFKALSFRVRQSGD